MTCSTNADPVARRGAVTRPDPPASRVLRPRRLAVAVPVVALLALAPAAAQARPAGGVGAAADVAVSKANPAGRYGDRGWLRAGGGWRTFLRFKVRGLAAPATGSMLVLRAPRATSGRLQVRVVLGGGWSERRVAGRSAPRVGAIVGSTGPRRKASRRIVIPLKAAIPADGSYSFVLTAPGGRVVRLLSRETRGGPRLVVNPAAVVPQATAPRPVPAPASAPAGASGPPPGRVWTSPAEMASRPTSGAAWTDLKAAADSAPGTANISDQDSNHDVNTLAAALVFARTGTASYRAKVVQGIGAAIGTEAGGRTLALGRNLAGYVAAADLIGLGSVDPALDARFRSWLTAVRTTMLDGLTLVETHEQRPNNWGTMAGASRIAADVYLGDSADLARAAKVFAGYLGDRASYAGFKYGDASWQADPRAPVGILPPGAQAAGLSIDGAMPDDMRRGCAITVPPCHTEYAWEGLQGALVQAEILNRQGMPAWAWGDRALLRAVEFLNRLDRQFGGWWAGTDDDWQPWLINRAYGTSYPAKSPAGHGKIMGWTDWTHGR